MTEDMKRLHIVELNIMSEIIRIVDKYDLRYYILGGTLLGAVRHKGFIPWDDDMDIGMPRPDYEKFIDVARHELRFPYHLHDIKDSSNKYAYYYARVEDPRIKLTRTKTIAKLTISSFVDVFPLDGAPPPGKERSRWLKKCRRLYNRYIFSQYRYVAASEELDKKRPIHISIARYLTLKFKLDAFVDTKTAWQKLDRELKRYNYDNEEYLINFCGFWGLRELFSKKVYGMGRLFQFENLMLNGPDDFDYVLTQMYGDYKTPPSKEERDHHYLKIVSDTTYNRI